MYVFIIYTKNSNLIMIKNSIFILYKYIMYIYLIIQYIIMICILKKKKLLFSMITIIINIEKYNYNF